jgi:hypothetical protein
LAGFDGAPPLWAAGALADTGCTDEARPPPRKSWGNSSGNRRRRIFILILEIIMSKTIAGIKIPDSKMAREVTELVRDTESDLLFNHSSRVFVFGALAGQRMKLDYDPELLYIGAMFHDMGLTEAFASERDRFEVDSANAARNFMRQHGVGEADVDLVWDAIALHTTPGIPEHKKPVVALVTAGVEMDVLGIAYDKFSDEQRQQVVQALPRQPNFKEAIIEAFTQGMIKKPDSTFGTVNADVLALKDPKYRRVNFCSMILGSSWNDGACGHVGCGHDHKH